MRRPSATASPLLGLLVLGLTLGLGCAGFALAPRSHFHYFEESPASDAWRGKISGWQQREKADPVEILAGLPSVAQAAADEVPPASPAAVIMAERQVMAEPQADASSPDPGSLDLRTKYSTFLSERKRATAREFASWVQAEAKHHYLADGPIDHWATLEETLKANGDDCDGLELLTFRGLRELGFADDEVFRAIVYRPSDGQHHMVTFWFESPDDPWVIDPTGAMTAGMPHMSDLPNWVPLKVFSETVEYSVRRGTPESRPADLAAN